ncbi:hypothetical protein GF366_02265 [Candidatus Peregrinibacteria bacterium]|nr:hypothetical protein [Candidatus Peregrinibacteria bacterium]
MSNFKEYIAEFRKRFDFPEPGLSYQERQRRRMAWRNERTLYKRKCDKTGENIIASYSKDEPFPVYKPDAWFGDDWDALDYGQDFDFNRPFFEQFFELQKKVPRIALIAAHNVNCDYCNVVGDCKNCYLLFGSISCEDCMYGNPYYSKDCIDSLVVRNSELCYECTDCEKLYECFFCQGCSNSKYIKYCFDVESCSYCFLCVGLRQKQYCILNEQCSKEEYDNKIKELWKKSPEELRKMLNELKLKTPVKFMEGKNNENVVGDYIYNSKDCYYLFNSSNCENVHYATQIMDSHNIIETDIGEMGNFIYENSGFYKVSNMFFCHWCWEVADLMYCSTCTLNTKDCFGCISLKHKQYCILNKQYSKEEYKKLIPKIIQHMKKTGEWGDFFPIKNSVFGYNETIAQEYHPLSRKEVTEKGWKWVEPQERVKNIDNIIPGDEINQRENKYSKEILKLAVKCKATGRLFRIMSKELKFYEKYNLPLPEFHPDERHLRRLALRNPRKIWNRVCYKCGADIKTTYSPDDPQVVYCEKCYLKKIY